MEKNIERLKAYVFNKLIRLCIKKEITNSYISDFITISLVILFPILFFGSGVVYFLGASLFSQILKISSIIFLIGIVFSVAFMSKINSFQRIVVKKFEKVFVNFIYERYLKNSSKEYFKIRIFLNIAGDTFFRVFLKAIFSSNISFKDMKDVDNFNYYSSKFTTTQIYRELVFYLNGLFKDFEKRTYNRTEKTFNKTTQKYESKKTSLNSKYLTAFNYFGFNKVVSEDELKSAYRKKLKNVHPDAGGTTEEFLKAKNYYEMLVNAFY